MTSEERHENNARTRRNSHNRPAKYVNGVRLSEDESGQHHITQSQGKVQKPKNEAILKAAAAPRSAPHASQGCRHKQMVEKEMTQNILMDDDQELRDGLDRKRNYMKKEYFRRSRLRLDTTQA